MPVTLAGLEWSDCLGRPDRLCCLSLLAPAQMLTTETEASRPVVSVCRTTHVDMISTESNAIISLHLCSSGEDFSLTYSLAKKLDNIAILDLLNGSDIALFSCLEDGLIGR